MFKEDELLALGVKQYIAPPRYGKEIGRGGYGRVYLSSRSNRVWKRTFDEWELYAALWQMKHKHPLLVRVYDVRFNLQETQVFPPYTREVNYIWILRERADDDLEGLSYTQRDELNKAFGELKRPLQNDFSFPDDRSMNRGYAYRHGKPQLVIRDLGAMRVKPAQLNTPPLAKGSL